MAHKGKTVMLILGKDVFNTISKVSTERYKFTDLSSKYGENYQDDRQGEMYMGNFTGDDVFPDMTDLWKFAGIDEDRWGEFDLLNDVEVYVRSFTKFRQSDKDKWGEKAEEVGHLEQVIYRCGFNGKTKRNYKWEDFE